MPDAWNLMVALAAGSVIGGIFFGGLWWTVRKGVSSEQPALWFLGSLVLRASMTLTGFSFVSRGNWQRLLMCLLGFLVARPIVTRFTRPGDTGGPLSNAASHASEL